MRGGMGRPHVEDHFLADVLVDFPQFRVRRGDPCHGIRRFDFANSESHKIDNAREVLGACKSKSRWKSSHFRSQDRYSPSGQRFVAGSPRKMANVLIGSGFAID